MLETTHSLASALIVSKIPSPAISFPLIIVAHYLLDLIPHWDTGGGLTSGLKSKKMAFIETLVDLAIAGILVFVFFQKNNPFSPTLWFGVLLGITPDLLQFPALFLNLRPFPFNVLEKFHNSLHKGAPSFLSGLIPQLIIILLILLFNH